MRNVDLDSIKGNVISGIYKINYPNGKMYIGQSQNIYKRVLEHNQRARHGKANREIQVCEKAIAKYGEINNIDILEVVNDLSQLDNRETYWIKYYDTTNPEKGYNLLNGGNCSQQLKGYNHINAAFTKEQLDEIIDLLQNHTELSLIDIANKYGVVQDTILRISTGKTYVNPDLSYPLRRNNHDSQKKNEWSDYFDSADQLIQLKDDLKYSWWLQMDNGDLYKKYGITRKLLYAINKGEKFGDIGNYTYPIRTRKTTGVLTKDQVQEMLSLLKTTDISMTQIGEQFGVSRCTVSKINKGESHIIKGYSYPARTTK